MFLVCLIHTRYTYQRKTLSLQVTKRFHGESLDRGVAGEHERREASSKRYLVEFEWFYSLSYPQNIFKAQSTVAKKILL